MLRDIRKNYLKFELSEESISKDPFDQLNKWLYEAIDNNSSEPTAMVVSTIDPKGKPDSRIVLLKEITNQGLTFFTNYNSKKGKQINVNKYVSALFFWPEMERQIRVSGTVKKISSKHSESYFKSRPIESQLAAWASPQSEIIENRQVLEANYDHFKQHFENHEMTKPPHWGGYIIQPEYFEFWQGRLNRLHDRIEYSLSGHFWVIHRLAP